MNADGHNTEKDARRLMAAWGHVPLVSETVHALLAHIDALRCECCQGRCSCGGKHVIPPAMPGADS